MYQNHQIVENNSKIWNLQILSGKNKVKMILTIQEYLRVQLIKSKDLKNMMMIVIRAIIVNLV